MCIILYICTIKLHYKLHKLLNLDFLKEIFLNILIFGILLHVYLYLMGLYIFWQFLWYLKPEIWEFLGRELGKYVFIFNW